MSIAENLIEFIELRFDEYDLTGVDPEPDAPWSYSLDEPSLLIHTLRGDIDDIRRAESVADANKLLEQTRAVVLTFHVGGMH